AAEGRDAGAQDVHRVRGGGKLLEYGAQPRAEASQALHAPLVGGELGVIRQLFMDQEVGDLLEFAGFGDVEDVVAAIVQVVAAAPDRADRRVARDDAGE